jgi:hypothetical protein
MFVDAGKAGKCFLWVEKFKVHKKMHRKWVFNGAEL